MNIEISAIIYIYLFKKINIPDAVKLFVDFLGVRQDAILYISSVVCALIKY